MKTDQMWHCMYLSAADPDTTAGTLRALLAAQKYEAFDPFPGGKGTPPGLRTAVRLFVTPAHDGWVRVVGRPPADIVPDFSRRMEQIVIYGWLDTDGGGFAVYEEGLRHDDSAALVPYLLPGKEIADLEMAIAGKVKVSVLDEDEISLPHGLGGGSLPPHVRQRVREKGMPRGASWVARQMERRLLGRPKRGDDEDARDLEAARAALAGKKFDLWNSLNGQRVRAIAAALRLPDNWRLPDWQIVSEAYHVYRLRERNPRMALLPGDKEALEAVPHIGSYLPVYMGRG